MNKVILMGRLTADPEFRQTQNGVPSCKFRVAINRNFKNQQTGQYDADFISCTAWRQTAEFVNKYFHKGSMICVEGSLRSGSYQDKNHPDVTHYTTDVQVDNVEFTGSKSETGTAGGYNNNNGNYGNNGYNNNNNGYGNNNGYNNYNGNNNYNANNNNSYDNGYNNNGNDGSNYGNSVADNQTPPPQMPNNDSMSYGNVNDYEQILGDGDVPF